MSGKKPDPAILRARELFEASGLTLDRLGTGMGYATGIARRAAWQFLNKTDDPRLSMLRRFATAMAIDVAELLAGRKKKARPD
jgi:transcriptional regulator with XRE-family HTH domain